MFIEQYWTIIKNYSCTGHLLLFRGSQTRSQMVHLLSTRHRRQDSPFPFPSSYCKGNTVSNSALVKVGLYVLQEGLAWGNTVSNPALVKVGLYTLHIPRAQNPCYDQTQTTFLYSVEHQKCHCKLQRARGTDPTKSCKCQVSHEEKMPGSASLCPDEFRRWQRATPIK
jgi:hypothetical protein